MNQFDQDIVQDFLTESGELLEQLDRDLVLLEPTPQDPALLNQVFRALHTIKGSASFLALTNLVAVAHAAESALNAARAGSVVLNKRAMDLILAAVDILKKQFDNLRAGEDLVAGETTLIAELAAIGEGRMPGAVTAAPAAPPTPAVAATYATPASQPAMVRPAHSPIVAPPEALNTSSQSSSPSSGDSPTQPGLERLPLRLDDSKSSLIEFLVADVRESIAAAQTCLAGFADPAQRPSVGHKLVELGESLGKSAVFFGFAHMSDLADILQVSGNAAADLDREAVAQLAPRLAAAVELLREQADGLAFSTILKRPITGLRQAVDCVITGKTLPASQILPEHAAHTAALIADGVLTPDPTPSFDTTAQQVAPRSPAIVETALQPDPAPSATTSAPAPQSQAPEAVPSQASAVAVPPIIESPVLEAASTTPTPSAGSAPASAAAHAPAPGAEQTIRVEVGRLESLLNLVGELVLQKNRLSAIARGAVASNVGTHEFHETFQAATGNLDRVTSDIQVAVMRTRMQPLDKLFGKYPRLIRDLARKTGKEIRLVIDGGETEVDKSVIEELGDPLVHIMRNSSDHGIEMPAQRTASGKSLEGVITLSARHEGSFVRIAISDDGRGLSRKKLGAKAVERGLVTEQALSQMSDKDVFAFIFAAGFSTAEKVTDLSGRGVGMDVVRTNIEKIKGIIELDSTEGKGTTITIKIPLTVAILTAMMVKVGTETYAVPLTSIVEIVKPDPQQVSTIKGQPVMRLRDAVLPLLNGCEIFDLPEAKRAPSPFAVIVAQGDRRVGLMVSGLIGQQEVVIKPLHEMVDGSGPISGATVRDDGGVSLIVDVAQMVRLAEERAARPPHEDCPPRTNQPRKSPSLASSGSSAKAKVPQPALV